MQKNLSILPTIMNALCLQWKNTKTFKDFGLKQTSLILLTDAYTMDVSNTTKPVFLQIRCKTNVLSQVWFFKMNMRERKEILLKSFLENEEIYQLPRVRYLMFLKAQEKGPCETNHIWVSAQIYQIDDSSFDFTDENELLSLIWNISKNYFVQLHYFSLFLKILTILINFVEGVTSFVV